MGVSDGVFVWVCGGWVRAGGSGYQRKPEYCGAEDDGGQDHVFGQA